jgi:mannose-1-phosphate guanylyltransferase
MAGGAGTRLWPLSRKGRPKQLIPLIDGASLLELSFQRLDSLLPPDRIWVIAGEEHREQITAALPNLSEENFIGEPCGRDTANAVGLSAEVIGGRDSEAVIGVFTADHIIEPIDRFQQVVSVGFDAAERDVDALVTFGIKPTFAHPGLGYVRLGDEVDTGVGLADGFIEKPGESKAKEFLESGGYLWNSGMFVWRAETVLNELASNLPDSAAKLNSIGDSWQSPRRNEVLNEIYPTLAKISIDYAVMEKARRVLVVEMDVQWTDLGSWITLATALEADSQGNVQSASNAIFHDSEGVVIVAEDDHLIAAMGVTDLVIVRSPDATLVCTREQAMNLKDLVEKVREQFGDRYD